MGGLHVHSDDAVLLPFHISGGRIHVLNASGIQELLRCLFFKPSPLLLSVNRWSVGHDSVSGVVDKANRRLGVVELLADLHDVESD